MTEIQEKLQRLRASLARQGLNAALLSREDNIAWLTGGANAYVNTATDGASASLLVTPDHQYVLTNNIEAPRLKAEERLEELGFALKVAPWYEPGSALGELSQGLRLGADTPQAGAQDLGDVLAGLRQDLLPAEQERFRALGRACGEAMNAAICRVRPGMTEFEIAGLLAQETLGRGALPVVNLIATDERIFRFRHPLPTAKVLERYAMLVLCGRQSGLVASCTRLVHFGPLPDDLRRKMAACARVDATFIAKTRPGASLGDVFQAAMTAYADTGYAGEWQLHHQGGPAAYQPREFVAWPTTRDRLVRAGEAYAWNPSITGVKSEDTILVGPETNEVLTGMRDWPMIEVRVGDQPLLRPAILEA